MPCMHTFGSITPRFFTISNLPLFAWAMYNYYGTLNGDSVRCGRYALWPLLCIAIVVERICRWLSSPLLPLLGVVIGGLLSIMGAYISSTLADRRRQTQESNSLAHAFRGEISALVRLTEDRNYQQQIQEVVEHIKTTRQPFFMSLHVRRKYFAVYNNNVNRIGLLWDPLPEKIACLYAQKQFDH